MLVSDLEYRLSILSETICTNRSSDPILLKRSSFVKIMEPWIKRKNVDISIKAKFRTIIYVEEENKSKILNNICMGRKMIWITSFCVAVYFPIQIPKKYWILYTFNVVSVRFYITNFDWLLFQTLDIHVQLEHIWIS